jgi:hypothetical protein
VWTRSLVFGLLLLACHAVAAAPNTLPVPIRTPDDLRRYLADMDGPSPLDEMPLGARHRFLAGVTFGRGGVGGFSTEELNDTLTSAQIRPVLALFDLEEYAGMLEGLPRQRDPRGFLSEFEHRFDAFHAAANAEDSELVIGTYRLLTQGIDPALLALSLDPYDRALLYGALLKMLEIDLAGPDSGDARQLLEAMHESGEATRMHVSRLFAVLTARRDFTGAHMLANMFPTAALPQLPILEPVTAQLVGNSVLHVGPDGKRMSRASIDIERGLQIVVVAGCHFARDAADAIGTDPALDLLFNEYSTWLAPSSESLAAAADWNRQFPNRPILIAWSDSDWPQVTSWAMPTFLVFRDGVLLRSWSGWPADTGMATLRAELSAAGISY